MDTDYNAYNPEIAESLIEMDNAIDRTKYRIAELEEELAEAKKNSDLDSEENLKWLLDRKHLELERFRQERQDIIDSC